MGLELAKAYVTIVADGSQFPASVEKEKPKITNAISGISLAMATAGGSILANVASGIVSSVVSFGRESLGEAIQGVEASTRLAAVLKATGYAAGFSAGELERYAGSLQEITTHGDEEIKAGMAKLLTFKSVQGDIFKRATEATLDLADVGFGSAVGASVQLGKALEDPVRGIGALRRAGVSFTAEQKAQIKQYVQSNQLLKAQEIVLGGVEAQVKGVAKAMGETDAGKLKIIDNQFGELKEKLGGELLPLLVDMKQQMLEIAEVFTEWGVNAVRAIRVIRAEKEAAAKIAAESVGYVGERAADRMQDAAQVAVPGGGGTFGLWRTAITTGQALAGQKDWSDVRKALVGNSTKQLGADSGSTQVAEDKMNQLADKLGQAYVELDNKPKGEVPKGPNTDAMDQGGGGGKQKSNLGFASLEEFGRRLQESLLGDDKQQRMVDLTQEGVNIQKQMLATMMKTGGQAQPAVLG